MLARQRRVSKNSTYQHFNHGKMAFVWRWDDAKILCALGILNDTADGGQEGNHFMFTLGRGSCGSDNTDESSNIGLHTGWGTCDSTNQSWTHRNIRKSLAPRAYPVWLSPKHSKAARVVTQTGFCTQPLANGNKAENKITRGWSVLGMVNYQLRQSYEPDFVFNSIQFNVFTFIYKCDS